MDQCYLHEKTVVLGPPPRRDPKVLLVRPSPFPSALIQRGDSWPLPRVESIQILSTNPIEVPIQKVPSCSLWLVDRPLCEVGRTASPFFD